MTAPDRLRIVVMGYIVRGPLGGMTWHYLHYVLGLLAMGHEVAYLEDSGDEEWSCYNPETSVNGPDPSYGLRYARDVFAAVGSPDIWGYYDRLTDTWHGPLAERAIETLERADVLINISGANRMRSWSRDIPVRIFIDTDPAFTQIRNLTDPERMKRSRDHNVFLTFGANTGRPECAIPDDGLGWTSTRQPIVPDLWHRSIPAAEAPYRTVMQWDSYEPLAFQGRRYGLKSHSFDGYRDLPRRVSSDMEIALGGANAPHEELLDRGWKLADPLDVAKDPWSYVSYVQGSKAEFSVAKEGYVTSRSGWFSERSAAFLTCGRPVIVQNTGFTDWLPGGAGVVPFGSPDEAEEAIEQVGSTLSHHSRAALEVADTYFRADRVLSEMIDRAMT
ncbi:MAG: glycosyltransferase [Actinomycetota bacterium]